MIRRAAIIGATTVALGACANKAAPEAPYQITTPYADSDFAPWKQRGDATLRGQAFMTTRNGEVRTCAGNDVLLMPRTEYNKEIIVHVVTAKSANFGNRDERANEYTRKSICNASGNFIFDGLPPGLKWYVVVDVTWNVPLYGKQGGMLAKGVIVNGAGNDVIVTDRDLVQ